MTMVEPDISAITTLIYNAVSGVADIGNVYNHQRWAVASYFEDTSKSFTDSFQVNISGESVIRGWTISPVQILPERKTMQGQIWTVMYDVIGRYGVKNSGETEPMAMALSAKVMAAINNIPTLTGSRYPNIRDVPRLDAFEPRVFGDYLCHTSEIKFSVGIMVTI